MENILAEPNKKSKNSRNLGLYAFKLVVGLLLGIVFSVVGQEIFEYGQLSAIFVTLITVFTVLRISRNWSPLNVGFLALFFTLLFVFIKTYITLALET